MFYVGKKSYFRLPRVCIHQKCAGNDEERPWYWWCEYKTKMNDSKWINSNKILNETIFSHFLIAIKVHKVPRLRKIFTILTMQWIALDLILRLSLVYIKSLLEFSHWIQCHFKQTKRLGPARWHNVPTKYLISQRICYRWIRKNWQMYWPPDPFNQLAKISSCKHYLYSFQPNETCFILIILILIIIVGTTDMNRIQMNETQVKRARDALVKSLYGKLHIWIVSQINDIVSHQLDTKTEPNFIGILDMPGFGKPNFPRKLLIWCFI